MTENRVNKIDMNVYDKLYAYIKWCIGIGQNIVPLSAEKKSPSVSWRALPGSPMSAEDVVDRLIETNSRNIGMLTGYSSDRIVLDLDLYKHPEAINSINEYVDFSKVCLINTARGGIHIHFKYNGLKTGIPIDNVEVKSDGALVVIPPSKMSYGQYTYDCSEALVKEPTIMPQELHDIIGSGAAETKGSFRVGDGPILDGSRDNTIFNLSRALLRGGMSKEEVIAYARTYGATCKPPFSSDECDRKVNSALRGMPDSLDDLTEIAKAWIESQHGMFDIKDMRMDLDVSRARWKELSTVLEKLVKSNYIVRVSSMSGRYRRRETSLAEIDFANVETRFVDVKLPLGLDDLVTIMPKNIIVIAGSQDAGKTALMLNIVRDNMNTHDVRYYSSEMGANEFKSRLNMFEMPMSTWKFKAYERSANFADVIAPDAVNIIDYLEIGDSFYQVGQQLADIFDALNDGIAIVAIQKDANTPLGRGGSFGLEKPRLYCTVDKNPPLVSLKVLKAKNWKSVSRDPNGLGIDFRIQAGCMLKPQGGWEYKGNHTKTNNGRRQ